MPSARYDRLDALRGTAIVWMTVYHFCFDLNHFRWIRQNFYADPFWTWQRTAIVSLFLFCAGLSQAVAHAQRQTWPRFWRRWAQVAGCALLVTAGSWFMFPRSYIFFGVLHGIAVMLVVVRLTAGWGRWLWLAGAAVAAVWALAPLAHATWPALEVLNRAPFHWLGLVSRKPVTEDYVPVFPWLAVMWWGMAAGQAVLARRPALLQGALPRGAGALAWMGRWSLSWYMLHQPVLICIVAGATWLLR
jgi:uncharacterized membrane protein